jgi:hypothetical protein
MDNNAAKETVDHLRLALDRLEVLHELLERDRRRRQRRFLILGAIIGVLLVVIFRHHPSMWR